MLRLAGGCALLRHRRFAVGAEAVGFAGEVVAIEIAVDPGQDGSEDTGIVEREGNAAEVADGIHLVAGDDFDAKVAGGPGKDAALLIERCHAPDGGREFRLPDAGTAAEGERADVHAVDFGDGGGPLRPMLYIEQY